MELDHIIDVASGRKPADLVFRNGSFVNLFTNTVEEADIAVAGTHIAGIGSYEGLQVVDLQGQVLCPGFIDAHVHIESSMLSVPEFARTVVAHGTTAVVADPHEIANVMGTEGIRFILRSSKYCPIDIYLMLSSCVPASRLESSGAELSAIDLLPFLGDPWVLGLAEMMDFNGVIQKDPEVLDKIRIVGKTPIDGHAPGLGGKDLCAYIAAGIRSDHEACTARGRRRAAPQGHAPDDPRGVRRTKLRRAHQPCHPGHAVAHHVRDGRQARGRPGQRGAHRLPRPPRDRRRHQAPARRPARLV